MRITHTIWRGVLGLLPGEIASNETGWLLSPHQHMPLLQQRRALMLINRVRLFALLFALLTPLWIVVDVLTLPAALWERLVTMRLLATVAFAALVMWCPHDGRLLRAYQGMATLFAIPTLFYIGSHLLLTQHHLEGISAAIGTGYAFLPFVLLAAFAIFPLTLLENLAFVMPVLLAYALAWVMDWSVASWPSFGGEFWLLSLLAGVSALAGISQLAFIIALVGQTIRDPLTTAFSRRSGIEMLELQLVNAERNQLPLAIAFIDMDHFKSINDVFGHAAGDKTLKLLVQQIQQNMRRGDVLVRWGGEEFLLLMPNTDRVQAEIALERLRQQGLGQRPDGSPLTASIGLAERLADKCNARRQLVELADARMYRAKQLGRNQVVSR
ncbi:diguanylate cyclase [Aquitalea sp. USM4]|uniref:GGDEF domain-containing protein n=1 Tax=Aquitalea sp. USM4 TaxID=1590041 RepID=UPI00103D8CF1|nr:GGDEF domain-containing protein [Aquitalea sp. USM4]QBJ77555.1 GGDEF domain-containing protein [Aquitalea sp. USM4]